jgi:hypothetical protein
MTTITLDAIKSRQDELAGMIAAFEAQVRDTKIFVLPEIEITLQPGEHYAGIIVGKEDEPSHHLILLPGEAESVTWKGSKDWAAEIGGELPTRREQSLLFANLHDQFQSAWYWSCEEHASDSACAWIQDFGSGYQGNDRKGSEFRARAVRRLPISA